MSLMKLPDELLAEIARHLEIKAITVGKIFGRPGVFVALDQRVTWLGGTNKATPEGDAVCTVQSEQKT